MRYTYFESGNVSNIMVIDPNDAGDPNGTDVVKDLNLYYNPDGSLWIALWDEWEIDRAGDYVDGSYRKLAAREFRSLGGRQRYLTRDVDPSDLMLLRKCAIAFISSDVRA